MTITLKDLRLKGACKDQVELFKKTFGKEVLLTKKLVLKHGSQFDLYWVAQNYFSDAHMATYVAACAPHMATYVAACDAHMATYVAACDAHWATYEAACASAFWACVEKQNAGKE